MITRDLFGKTPSGDSVYAYKIENKNGAYVRFLSMGGIINQITVPDRNGKPGDIVCGFDSVDGYLNGAGYHGSLVGRFANRIRGAKFTLNGKEYVLAKNDGNNHLHGGNIGFNRKIWAVHPIDDHSARLSIISPDGEEGYPGNLKLDVTYTFDDDNTFSIRYEAESDADTPANFTNHSYFNLDGFDGGDILSHELYIDCVSVTENDSELVPTGKIIPVEGTKFDFRKFREIKYPFDNNFILNNDGKFRYCVGLRSKNSGRAIELSTDMPGIQIYDAVMMNNPVPFKNGVEQKPFHAVALETQFFPDSVNIKEFPSCILKAGDKYDHTTAFKFTAF